MNTAQKMMLNRPGYGYGDVMRRRLESGDSYNNDMAQQEYISQFQRFPHTIAPDLCDYYQAWNYLTDLVSEKQVVSRYKTDIEEAIDEWGYNPPTFVVL